VATFEPISLGGVNHVAELQTRIDRKCLVGESTLWELLDPLAPTVRVLEIEDRHSCHYQSTYVDTDNFALHSAAVQGRRKRFKVRSRTYGDDGPCFLEVKAKMPSSSRRSQPEHPAQRTNGSRDTASGPPRSASSVRVLLPSARSCPQTSGIE
jgi:hypothetical protein